MISVFQIFKMVFGVIASIAVLYFLITYAGSYGESQKDVQRSLILKNFRQLAEDVYMTSNPHDFDFSKFGTSLRYDTKASVPTFRFNNNELQTTMPLFFRYGDAISVTQGRIDYGWWRFNYVMAAPQLTVVFNPVGRTDEIFDAMRNITEALPDTVATDTNFLYTMCGYDSGTDTACSVCLLDTFEKYDFRSVLNPNFYRSDPALCTRPAAYNQVLVTVSPGCAASSTADICVNPSGGVFYMRGSAGPHPYMDGLDIAAAVIGGTSDDGIHGIEGENLYTYKQGAFREQMKMASDIGTIRATLMYNKLSGLLLSGRIESGSDPALCMPQYVHLRDALQGVSSVLYYPNYYSDSVLKGNLKSALSDASDAYRELANNGCELLKVT
jgi:hypothetical protein